MENDNKKENKNNPYIDNKILCPSANQNKFQKITDELNIKDKPQENNNDNNNKTNKSAGLDKIMNYKGNSKMMNHMKNY